MTTPYNTGKVQIGLCYQPPSPMNCRDMDRVQNALISPSPRVIKTRRQELRSFLFDAVLWTASMVLIFALFKAPAIWSFIQSI